MNKNKSRTVWLSDDGDQRKKNQHTTHSKSLPPGQQTAYLHRHLTDIDN